MATFTIDIPDADAVRVTAALCNAGGYADVSVGNARQFVIDYIVSTVSNVEQAEWRKTLAAQRGPTPVTIS
jgi:hypothetical protein